MSSQQYDATENNKREDYSWLISDMDSCEIDLSVESPGNECLLLYLAITGHTPAVAHIYNRYYKAIYAYALLRVNDPMLAEDIASEVLTRFIEVLDRSEYLPKSLRSWLFGVAYKVVTDHYRRKSRRQITNLDDTSFEEVVDFGYGPLDSYEQTVQKESLKHAFGQLTQAQKDVLSLRFGAAMSLEECAQQLKRSVGSVKVLQYRGLQRLRTLLRTPES